MIRAILLSFAVGGFAMWLWMRESTNAARHLAAYYQGKYRDAMHPAAPVDPVWAEFLRDQWSR